MNNYINEYGLINSSPTEGNAENSPLWALEYLLLVDYEDKLKSKMLTNYITECKTKHEGLYGQRPEYANNGKKEDYMSPDQLIAFLCHDYRTNNMTRIKSIWKYLKTHMFTYDNMSGQTDFDGLMQPMAVVLPAILVGHKYLMPLLSLICFISCVTGRKETSGKLKAWTIMKTLSMKKTFWLCTLVLPKTWKQTFEIYFKHIDHPIRLAIESDPKSVYIK